MMWFVIASLLILVLVLRSCFVTGIEFCRENDEREGYVEEYIRYSEHSEN